MIEQTNPNFESLRDENERLRTRLAELRSRLKEPEEIIRAIRYGEVDAFVVSEAPGERIYTLRRGDALYRVMIEDMQEGAVALNALGTILYCNWHFARLMKAKRDAVLGGSIFAFVPDQSRSFFDVLRTSSSSGTSRQEAMLRAADGQLVPVLLTLNSIDFDDEEVFCMIVTDLTEQKRQEEIVSAARRKDEFLAMLAHELRNPIAPIGSAAAVVRLTAPSDPDVQWAAGVIERQVLHLTRLVDDLLDVSRITSGKLRLNFSAVELSSVIAGAVEESRPMIDDHRHSLNVDLSPGPLYVRGDAARLRQVVGNLLNNAAKFTPDGGRILLSMEQHGAEAIVRVSDNGVGISSEMLPKVFELFTQVDTSLERSQGGLGIGLALVKRLVEMHGGRVSVVSGGSGQGSEFIINLPLIQHDRVGHSEPASLPVKNNTKCRVLIIDDNRDAAETLARLIHQNGHEVRVGYTGETALLEAKTYQPHLILLDIGLPGLNGYETAKQLRAIDGLEHTVLVAVTGYGQEEDRRRALAAGFHHHWVKPCDLAVLQSLLASMSNQSS